MTEENDFSNILKIELPPLGFSLTNGNGDDMNISKIGTKKGSKSFNILIRKEGSYFYESVGRIKDNQLDLFKSFFVPSGVVKNGRNSK